MINNNSFDSMFYIVIFGVALISIIANWRIFVKADEDGWKCLIPFYNSYILAKIVFSSGWLFLFSLIPFVNIIYGIILSWNLGTCFEKGTGFKLGLVFLSPIFMLILAFDDSEYVGDYE